MVIVVRESSFPLLAVWIIVIVLVAVIGALLQTPPETINQVFNEDHHKTQYINIGKP
ncbi:hypothetical protein [Leek white stripe virus]|uniref:ORF 4 protein n=1 Tax=Leek white stripe virus TaxID=45224 RepID=Q83105_9TOMB|nr:hypothetical protein [Leek white stripe virus]CAA64250.1 ORF 4 [Leek white stripe virus]